MASHRFRVYYGPEDVLTAESPAGSPRNMVTLSVSEVLPLLAQAERDGRAWVQDFASDQVTISSDLYEVLLAYQHFRRPSA